MTGLTPDTKYAVTAVGQLPGGATTPASGLATIITPTSGASGTSPSPTATGATASSPFAGTLAISNPASGPQPSNYSVMLTPISGGSAISLTCTTSSCSPTGLKPDTTYLVSAVALP